MTSGRRFARAVYRAAVYPAGPLPTMITFSMSATGSRSLSVLTLLCIVARRRHPLRLRHRRRLGRTVLLAPRGDTASQLEVGDRTREGGQPEGEGAVGQDGADRVVRRDAERCEGPDHASVDPADAAGQRQRVAQ